MEMARNGVGTEWNEIRMRFFDTCTVGLRLRTRCVCGHFRLNLTGLSSISALSCVHPAQRPEDMMSRYHIPLTRLELCLKRTIQVQKMKLLNFHISELLGPCLRKKDQRIATVKQHGPILLYEMQKELRLE